MPRRRGGRSAPFLLGAGALLGVCVGALTACTGLGDLTASLPSADGRTRLPLDAWVVEGGITPEAITACRPPLCAPGVAVGLFRAAGQEAGRLESALADPGGFERGLARLASERRARRGDRRNMGSRATVARWQAEGLKGLSVTLTRGDGGRAAHGIVFARRAPDGLRAAVIAGESEAAVAAAAGALARSGL